MEENAKVVRINKPRLTLDERIARKVDSLTKCALKQDLFVKQVGKNTYALLAALDEVGRVDIKSGLTTELVCYRIGDKTTGRAAHAVKLAMLAHVKHNK